MICKFDDKINNIMEGLINNKFPGGWGVAVRFSEKIYDELERIFFDNNCLNIFYFNIFIKEILPEDLVIYIAKMFYNLFIDNQRLQEANETALDYFETCIPQMILNFSALAEKFELSKESSNHFIDKGFVLNAECYTSSRNIIENHASLSSEETYKYLKIILNLGVRIYDILSWDIFEVGHMKNEKF
jgi:hypothetical protein